MYGPCSERRNCASSGRAAEARRTHPAPCRAPRSSPLPIHHGDGSRARKASEQRLGSSRTAKDAASTPAVVVETVPSGNGVADGAGPRTLPPDPGLAVEAAAAASADLDEQQLESRRLSNQAASTSTSASLSSFDDAGDPFARLRAARPSPSPTALSLLWSSARGPAAVRSQPTAPAGFPAFPTFPRPPDGSAPAGVSGSGPESGSGSGSAASQVLASPQVPPEAAQLYAGSSIANNLSTTTTSSDVLTPAFDTLQLEPPTPLGLGGGSASNAQRVYKATTSDAGGGGTGSTTAAPAVHRKRARVRVIDTSELLLARDEAVKTELLGRTWNDLLQFEERLGMGSAGGGGPGGAVGGAQQGASGLVAPGGPAQQQQQQLGEKQGQQEQWQQGEAVKQGADQLEASLEQVIGFIQQRVAIQREEAKAAAGTGQGDLQPGPGISAGTEAQQPRQQQQQLQLSMVEVAARDARWSRCIAEAGSWEDLQRFFGDHRGALSLEHLTSLLLRLTDFLNRGDGVVRGTRAAFYTFFDAVVEQVVFTAPDLRGPQAVRVIRALAAMPMTFPPRARSTLLAAKRVLVNSQPSVLPAALSGPGAGEVSSSQGGVILNASQVATTRRGTSGRQAAGSRVPAPGLAAGGGGLGGSFGQPSVPAWRLARPGSPGVGPAPAPGAGPVAAEPAAAGLGGASGGVDGWQGDMQGGDFAALAYYLGRINARARPVRMSLRLPPSFCRGLLRCAYATFGSCKPRNFGQMMYGLANLRVSPPPPWLYAFYFASARSLPAMNILELTMLMYGACRLPVKPPAPWIEAYLNCVVRRLDEMDPGGLALVLHSLGRLKYRPQRGFLDRYMRAVNGALAAGRLTPVELSHLLRGLSFLGVALEEGQLAPLWETSGAAIERGEFSAAQLANLAWALGLLKVRVPRRWYGLLLVRMRAMHQQLRPYHRRRLLAALHAFGSQDLQSWYELLRIPLEEMPGYEELKAQLAMRRVQRAKALLMAEKQREQLLREQAEKQGQQQRSEGQQAEGQQAQKQEQKPKATKKMQSRRRKPRAVKQLP